MSVETECRYCLMCFGGSAADGGEFMMAEEPEEWVDITAEVVEHISINLSLHPGTRGSSSAHSAAAESMGSMDSTSATALEEAVDGGQQRFMRIDLNIL